MLDMEELNVDVLSVPNMKKLSVERIYQKKSQLEHILLRPDTYIGSVEPVTQTMWVFDNELGMVNKEVTFVPGLYKIFDEIIVNAADNKQRDKTMNCLKIDIDADKNQISIWNNGQGIPVVEHKEEQMLVPSLIFGQLLTSSNYNDEEKKVTGGRNGYGAKLCNIFSTKFTVETGSKMYGKHFKQTWFDNMSSNTEPEVKPLKESEFTCITFHPDLKKFNMTELEKDIVSIMTRRAYDIAGCVHGIKVILNNKLIPIKSFKDYIILFLKDEEDFILAHESPSERWEIAATLSNKGFQQVSFVNSIATTKGGRHVDYITDQITKKLNEAIKKKNKSGKEVKPFQIKSHIWIFINCLVENPSFDSQTKEHMTLQTKNFGSKCELSDKFVNQFMKTGIVETIMSWIRFKAEAELDKKCSGKKHSKLKGISKLEDANDAGTKNSIDCTLILTEGDSAKSLAVSGLGVVGRDKYGVFPLKGKLLNVREASHKQVLENAEINNIVKIMGLQYKKKYDELDDLKTLRYGKLMIMTDQDQDGSHIKGLLINFIHHNWPSLLRLPFLEEFITPIVKATKQNEERSFYSLPEFEEWKSHTVNWNNYKIKYYKGLGTSTAKEAKEYFSNMRRHRITFTYQNQEDDYAIQLAFSKKMIEQRKDWLTQGMEERKKRRELGLPELYLYNKDTTDVTYNDFINKELILFSNMDNERSIPSAMDGLKPGQRKVLYTCFKRNDKREVKVAQLVGSVAEQSAYHHGEQALAGTIIGLAQNFVGSNNINILQPIGQFGTRLQGGKDAASPRYIFTMLSSIAKLLFSPLDSPLLNHLYDDNMRIEPEFYVPIIPMVLVNGAEGIGTGWSTKVPNYNPRDLVENLRRLLDGVELIPMNPYYTNFRGTIQVIDNYHYLVSGEIGVLGENTIEITELPVKTWTQAYKENVLEPMLHGSEKVSAFILDYKEYHTDTTVRFVVTLSPEKFSEAQREGFHKVFKLQSTISLTSMVLFDHLGCLKKYENSEQILKEFYTVRLKLYENRKKYMLGLLEAEALKLKNQARFILEKIDNKIIIENCKKANVIKSLIEKRYDSDPIKTWEAKQNLEGVEEKENLLNEASPKNEFSNDPDYNYLLEMPLWNLTKEKKEELLKKRDSKILEAEELKKKSPTDLWKIDLEKFIQELDKIEKQEKEESIGQTELTEKGGAKKKLTDKNQYVQSQRITPSVDEEFKKKWEKKPPKPVKVKKQNTQLLQREKEKNLNIEKNTDIKQEVFNHNLKQSTLNFKPTQPTKQNPKKQPHEALRDDTYSLSDEDILSDNLPRQKRVIPCRVAAKKKYIFDDSESDFTAEEERVNMEKINTANKINVGKSGTSVCSSIFQQSLATNSNNKNMAIENKTTMQRKKANRLYQPIAENGELPKDSLKSGLRFKTKVTAKKPTVKRNKTTAKDLNEVNQQLAPMQAPEYGELPNEILENDLKLKTKIAVKKPTIRRKKTTKNLNEVNQP